MRSREFCDWVAVLLEIRNVVKYCGRKGPVPSEIIERCKSLWEWRLAAVRSKENGKSHHQELVEFGWWFACGKFDDRWSVTQLLEVLKITHRAEPRHLVLERLGSIAQSMPAGAVACLEQLVEGTGEQWELFAWREQMRKVLTAARDSSDPVAQQAAEDLIQRIGARGFLEFRDLLPKT